MEEEQPAARRRKNGESISTGRISELPHPILHHILCFLSQKDAIRTCLLSKSWRRLGSTRPKIEFLEERFNGNKETFLLALHDTLLRYRNQKLSVEEFTVRMWALDSPSLSFLRNWIPILATGMGVRTFRLCCQSQEPPHLTIHPRLLKFESLENLHLEQCSLNLEPNDAVLLKNLQTLHLDRVFITEEAFERILSSCNSIENVSLYGCSGLQTIKVNKARNLKHFSFDDYYELYKKTDPNLRIEIEAPTIRTIRIVGCSNWYPISCFPNLKSLILNRVNLSNESFCFFSSEYLPLLERLTLDSCYGFEDFALCLSGSVKHLILKNLEDIFIKAAIDAPNIVEFVYEGHIPQLAVSLRTCSPDWRSRITLSSYSDFDTHASSWLDKLSALLGALSESEIYLKLVQHRRTTNLTSIEDVPQSLLLSDMRLYKPVAVEHLSLRGYYSCSSLPAFVNCLFCVCRPRYVGQYSYADVGTEWEREDKVLNESLVEILLMEREMRQYFWPQDLEEVSVVGPSDGRGSNPGEVRFRLKWRESCE